MASIAAGLSSTLVGDEARTGTGLSGGKSAQFQPHTNPATHTSRHT